MLCASSGLSHTTAMLVCVCAEGARISFMSSFPSVIFWRCGLEMTAQRLNVRPYISLFAYYIKKKDVFKV